MKEDNSIYLVWIVLVMFCIFAFLQKLVIEPTRRKRIVEDYVLVTGRIKTIGRFEIGLSGRTTVSYKFAGTSYDRLLMFELPCKNFESNTLADLNYIKTVNFPVAVSQKNPEEAIPLLRPEEFKIIGSVLPDSLRSFYSKYLDCTTFEKVLH